MALKTLRDQRRDPRRTLPAYHKFSKHRFTIKEYGGKYFTCRSFGKSRRERFSLTKKLCKILLIIDLVSAQSL